MPRCRTGTVVDECLDRLSLPVAEVGGWSPGQQPQRIEKVIGLRHRTSLALACGVHGWRCRAELLSVGSADTHELLSRRAHGATHSAERRDRLHHAADEGHGPTESIARGPRGHGASLATERSPRRVVVGDTRAEVPHRQRRPRQPARRRSNQSASPVRLGASSSSWHREGEVHREVGALAGEDDHDPGCTWVRCLVLRVMLS